MKLKFILMIALFAELHHAAAQVAFKLTSSPSAGIAPEPAVATDINGDGKVDLVCPNFISTPGKLTILTNNGHGGFAISSSPNVGNLPGSVAAADVNGDGKIDLISANYQVSTLSVLTNTGSSSFVTAATLSPGAGSFPSWIEAADVNGDGKPDLITANSGNGSGNTLSVLTNNGSGSFALASSPGVGKWPYSVTPADMNGDGKIDLISANFGTNTLSVLTNNGSGVFVTSGTYSVGNNPLHVAAGDINGDGNLDLISANYGTNTLSVLTNNGSGGFVSNTTINVGATPYSIALADVSGDGWMDLISASSIGPNTNGTISVFTNNGSGGFKLAVTNVVGKSPYAIVVDVNGDSRMDLISINYGNNALSVLMNVPILSINRLINNVRLFWPSSWTNWTLLQSTNLATTNWFASDGIANDGTNKSLTISSPIGNNFFRLSHP